MKQGCEAAAEIGMAIATPSAVKSELPLLQRPNGGIPFCDKLEERVAIIRGTELEGEEAIFHLDFDEMQLIIGPPSKASIELVVDEEGGRRRERYLLWKGLGGVIVAREEGRMRRIYRRKAAVQSLLWLLLPKMMTMFVCCMLACDSMDISKKDTGDLQISKGDALMVLFTGFVYIGLRLTVWWRLNLRMQLFYHVCSTWVWGVGVFYFNVYPPFGLSPLAMLVMTVTGSGIYLVVVLLAFCERLDGRGLDMFLVGLFVPIGVLVASQPLYLTDVGPKNYETRDYFGEYMWNVLVGVFAAVAICFEQLWYAHRFITSPLQNELSHKLDQIFGSPIMPRQRQNIQKI